MRRAALAALLLAAKGAWAEAPAESLRPDPRPEAPAEPASGPGGAAEAAAGALPAALAQAPALRAPPPDQGAPGPARDVLPPVPRRAPLIASEPPPPSFEGLAGVAGAELLFSRTPPVEVVVDGWAGEVPPPRPGAGTSPTAVAASVRPVARPGAEGDAAPALPVEPEPPVAYVPEPQPTILAVGPDDSPFAVALAVVPSPRPAGVVERAERVRAERVRGQVCGNPAIQGEASGPVGGGGCGIEGPVRVRSLDGVSLSTPATVDCATAEALLSWVREGARPAVGARGGGLAGIEVAGSYACRPRNNQAGAKLSEHGLGRAVDIGAVVLADGSRLSVARDWPDAALTAMHRAACGIFSTTLGPGSDGYHEDHLHYDTARGRGAYCR